MTEQDLSQRTPVYTEIDPKFGRRLEAIAHTGGIFEAIVPVNVIDRAQNREKAAEMLKDGMGLVIILNHPSAGDHLRVAHALFENEVLRNAQISIGIAHHQYPYPVAKLMDYTGVDAHGIVTENTMRKGKNRLHPTQKAGLLFDFAKSHIPWNGHSEKERISAKTRWQNRNKPLRQMHGGADYVRSAVETLNTGGVVFLGPQGKRSTILEPWEGDPVEMLLKRVADRKNIGFLFVGVDARGGSEGFNPEHVYRISIGSAIPYEELASFAAEKALSIDESVFVKLNETVPEEYRLPICYY